MTPQQIRDAIAASPELQALVPDTNALAAALSAGRTKTQPTEIGKGTIVEVLGLTSANTFLDIIDGDATFRHVKHLLTEGRLRLDSTMAGQLLASFVTSGVITQQQSDALSSLCRVPDPVSEFDVRVAIFNDDGTLKV